MRHDSFIAENAESTEKKQLSDRDYGISGLHGTDPILSSCNPLIPVRELLFRVSPAPAISALNTFA
jgi:hypothetical protein